MHAKLWHGARGAAHRDGEYGCHECGTTWVPYERWGWWPIALRWSPPGSLSRWRFFRRHGIQVASEGIGQAVFAQVWHFGPLKVVLGLRESYDHGGDAGCTECEGRRKGAVC